MFAQKSAGLLAAAATALLSAACSGSASTPEKAATAFVEKNYAGDADAVLAVAYIPEKDRRQEGLGDMLRGKIKEGVAGKKKKPKNTAAPTALPFRVKKI
ncbi:hypothetical protein [Kingella potus]|uniref:hypothetical protein n=1 Tax=Kingella potus TaxID=265175 RepID=UPI000E1B786E|nr:hypothetical protein [Kingella potus]UOP01096.1 putative porin [Kingella potus]